MFHNVQSKVNKKSTDNVESGTFANNTSIVRNAESFRNMECTLWKLQCKFSTTWKEWLKIFRKIGSKIIFVPQFAK